MSRAQRLCLLAALVTLPVFAALAETTEKTYEAKSPFAPVTQHLEKSKKQQGAAKDASDIPVDNGHRPGSLGPPVELHLSKAHGKKFDLRSLPFVPPAKQERPEREEPAQNPIPFQTTSNGTPVSIMRAVPPAAVPAAVAPPPIMNFDGLDFANWGAGHPPDTNGDAGPQYYIQTINTSIGVFRKSDGARVAAFTFNTFMSQGSFGNLCDTNNFGDPVVLYDSFEDRWVITDFAFQLDGSSNVVNPPGSFQCIAVSMNGDPVSGGWNYYSINTTGGLGDYPKFGIWPDGLYMSVNMFNYAAGGAFQNTRLYAFNKTQMYAGSPTIQVVSFDLPSDQFTALPANARLQTGTPPAGSPNYFATVWKYLNAIEIWKFHVDWQHTSLSTVTGPFDSGMAFWWEQFGRTAGSPPKTVTTAPTTANDLDTLYPRLMVQNEYSNIAGAESLWTSHTVGAGNPTSNLTSAQSAVRYYQVNVTGGTVAPATVQSFTYSPDATLFRYVPSVAVNRGGDMAIGYSTSNATTNPAMAYAGRLSGDAANTITQTEQLLFQGTGSQSGTCGGTAPCTRWGDYSAMTLDPDGCTFWYTNEYYAATGLAFNTRIGSFAFPSCTPVGGGGTISGAVTTNPGGSPIPGATVTVGARSTTADGSGNYSFSVPAGLYASMSASQPGFGSASAASIPVTDGGNTVRNFALTAAPTSSCFTDTTQTDFQTGVVANVDLNASPGDVVLLNADHLDQQNTTVGGFGVGITTTTWGGQTFTPALTGTLTKADINLFCSGCTGTTPNLTLSVRATSGGLPTGADLATATITGFNGGGATYYTAVFGTPASVIAGTQYALVIRPTADPSAGTYALTRSGTLTAGADVYPGGARIDGATSGTVWSIPLTGGTSTDAGFRVYINTGYPPSGTFVSSPKDANPAPGITPIWQTFSWNVTTPANTSIQFQLAGSNNANGPFTFVGPDGTSGTYFTTSPVQLSPQFYNFRYLEYEAFLATTNNTATPALNDATVCFNDVDCSGVQATITPTPSPVCGNSPGNTASAPPGMSAYAWGITNGTITSATNIQTITYTAGGAGTVTLTLTVTAPNGCIVSSSTPVTINTPPTKPNISGTLFFCTGSTTTLSSDSGSGNQWYLGGNPISGQTNQTLVVSAAGSYTVQVTDGNGCVSQMSNAAVVTESVVPPTPTISADTNATGTQDQACPEVPLTLHANGATGAVSYQWYKDIDPVGDGTSTYQATGSATYYVKAMNADGCATPQSAGYVVQNPTPHSPFISFRNQDSSVTTLHICQGSSQIVDSDSATGIHWWVDGVDQGPGNQSYTFTSTTPSTHTFTAQLDALGCHSQFGRTVTIIVDAMPPTPTISGDTNGTGTQDQACPEQPLTLHANGATGATSYTWYGDNAVIPDSTTDTLVVTYVANVSVTATNGTCTTPHSATYVVQNPTPHAPFISFRNQLSSVTTLSMCQGSSQIIDSDSATGIQWYEDGVAIPVGGGSQSYNFTPNAPGTHTFTAQLNALGCHSQFGRTVTVIVNALPSTPTVTPGGPTTFCAGGSVTLTSSSASGNQWLLNNAPIGGATGQTYNATATGNYSVRFTDGNGCSATSATTTVTVNPLPATPTIGAGGPTTFCAGGSVTLTSSSASGNQWKLNGAPIGGATSQTYIATASGDYSVQVTDGNGCSSATSATTTVTVNPNPNATITAPGSVPTGSTGNTASVASGGAGATYNWSITNGTITAGTGTSSITFTAGAIGTLTLQVTVTTSASCSDTKSANVTVGLPAVTVTSVSPTSGSINGHTAVTVNGTGFASGATVTFGGSAATSVVVVSATKITAVTPAHAAGQVNVTVTNTDTSTGTLTNGYTYKELFDPNGDHTIDPSDLFYLIDYLFLHGPAPIGGLAAGDANGDGIVDPADIFYAVNYLYLGGPKPYAEPAVHTESISAPMKGGISLGQPVLRGERYIIPVAVEGAPSAMSLRLRFDGAGEGVTIHRASGLQPAFEIVRHGDRELTYLVDYDGTMNGVVAHIEVPAGARISSIEIDPDMTLLCDRDGVRKATVSGGGLTVSGTTIDSDRSRIDVPRSER